MSPRRRDAGVDALACDGMVGEHLRSGLTGGRDVRIEDFDGDMSPISRVLGDEDGGHPALADLTHDSITLRKRIL